MANPKNQKLGDSKHYAAGSIQKMISAYYLLPTAYCFVLTVFIGCATTKEVSKENPALLYSEANNLYQDGDYNEAIDKYKKIIEDHPFSPFAEDAQLLLADAYYASAQYSDAASYYTNFVTLHPRHSKASYAMFQKGMSYFRDVLTIDRDQTNTQKALLAFSDVLSLYSESIYADKSKEMSIFLRKRLAGREFYIGKFYFKDKKYKGALARFAEILNKYPEAGLSDKVLYYIGKSYVGLGEKELARDAFTALITEFPNSSFARDAKKWLSSNQEG